MSKTFQSFEEHNYRLWFTGSLFASSGQWMQRVAQDWLVLTVLTRGGGLEMGVVTALQFLPILLFSPWAGLAADRFERRRLLQITQSLMMIFGFSLGFLILTGRIELWMVYILAFAGGTVLAFENPVRQSFVSELVAPRMLPNAVALNSTAFNSARLIGPALSGLIIDMVGMGWVFVVNGALLTVPIVTLALLRTEDLNILPKVPRQKGQLREGFQYIMGRRDIVLILFLMGVVSCFGLNFQITSALMATQIFDIPAGGYGLMSSFLAIGAICGSLMVARSNNPRLQLIIAAALFFGVALGLLALSPTYWWFLLIAIPTGALSMTLISSANAAVQISTAPQFRGRVMAIYSMIFLGTTPIGAPIVGWIGEQYGARWSMGIGAIITIVAALIAALWGILAWKIRLQWDGYHLPRLNIPGQAALSDTRDDGEPAGEKSASDAFSSEGALGAQVESEMEEEELKD